MLLSPQRNDPQRIVVLNPKGGCGKTTIATNLASYFAGRGPMPVLLDGGPAGRQTALTSDAERRRLRYDRYQSGASRPIKHKKKGHLP